MKHDLTTGTWQDDTGCPISIVLAATSDDDEPKKNTCPHCKKYHRKKPHCVEPDKCMWNKKYKGYRFKSICDQLEVDFKPRIKFSADLGGYAEKDDSGGE